jgi:hypothetical protein
MIAAAPEFDLLFLEYCFGTCGSRAFGELGPFAGLEGRYVTGLRALCTGTANMCFEETVKAYMDGKIGELNCSPPFRQRGTFFHFLIF